MNQAVRDGWALASFIVTSLGLPVAILLWCRREDFRNTLPQLLRGEDPEFQDYIRRIAEEEGGGIPQTT